VVTGTSGGDATSRRTLLQTAGAGGAAGALALLAGCGKSNPLHAQPAKLAGVPASDVGLLNQLLDLEHLGIAAYTAGMPLLRRPTSRAARRFLSQELSHAGELAGLIKKAHARPHHPKPSYDLGHPAGEDDVLRLLHRIERAQIEAYIAALAQLGPGPVRAAIGAILGNEAQHVAVIRSYLHQPAVPSAFLSGRE
jgi:hypothetical protein